MWTMTAAPLAVGVLLSIIGGIVRIRAWHGAMVESVPEARYRDVVAAHLGGAGFNGIVPMHGGDAVKVALVKRRVHEARVGALLGSLAPPAVVEALLTALLVAWALTTGILGAPSRGEVPLPLVGVGLVVVAAVLWALARRAPKLLRDVRIGMSALKHPELLVRRVVPWVVMARVIRLGALGCFMAAVGLPVTLVGVLLVMAIQGGVGSTGPASAPVRMAVLTASLPLAVGVHSVSLDTAAQLIAASQLGPMIANLTISVVVLAVTLRTASPKRVFAYCRHCVRAQRAATTPATTKP